MPVHTPDGGVVQGEPPVSTGRIPQRLPTRAHGDPVLSAQVPRTVSMLVS